MAASAAAAPREIELRFDAYVDDARRSPMSIAAQLRDAIPNAELALIANAGHVSNMEQPEGFKFNAQVRRFLSNLSA